MRYRFMTTVKKVEERSRALRAYKTGDTVTVERERLGWFVVLDGSWEALYVGDEKPSLQPGDKVSVMIEQQG